MKENNNEILNLLSIVLGICALCLLVLSTLLNVYSYRISSNEELIITNKNVLIDYTNGKDVILKNIEPGTTLEYIFNVYSKEDATGISNFEIYFDVTENNFASEYLYYKIEGTSSLEYESGTLAYLDYIDFTTGTTPHLPATIKPGEVQTYKLTIYYSSNTSTKKNNLIGKIVIDQGKSGSTENVGTDVPAQG